MTQDNRVHTTPAGRAVQPCLSIPDTRHSPKGVYSVRLRLSAADAQPYISFIDEAMRRVLVQSQISTRDEGAAPRMKAARVPYITEASGTVVLPFKIKADSNGGRTKKRGPQLFNERGELAPGLAIEDGAIITVRFVVSPFCTGFGAGVTLHLRSVQLIEPAPTAMQAMQ